MVSTEILGIPVDEIPETYTPIGVYALIECLNSDGEQVFVTRFAGMSALARVGAVTILHAQEMTNWDGSFEPDGDQPP